MERGTSGVSFLLVLTPFLFLNSTILFGTEQINPVAIAQKTLINSKGVIDCVKFCPDKTGEIEQTIIGLIRSSKKIEGALYLLSKRTIIDELIAAHQRGAKVDLVFDPSALTTQALFKLPKSGIPLKIYVAGDFSATKFASLMHLKSLIFTNAFGRKNVVASGSMNLTNNGLGKNQDQISFRDDPTIFSEHHKKIDDLLQCSKIQVQVPPSRQVIKQNTQNRSVKKKKKQKNKSGKRNYHTSAKKKFFADSLVQCVRYVRYIK